MTLLSKRHHLVDIENGVDANFNGVKFRCALQAGSFCDHDNVVQLLLTNRADVNFQGGMYVSLRR